MTTKADKKRIITVITAVLCIVVFIVLMFYLRIPDLFKASQNGTKVSFDDDFIKFMDVGQGDGAIIYSDGYCAVIDLGEATVSDEVLKDLALLNVNQIDMLVISHYHTDHIGGYKDVSEKYKIKNMIGPKITDRSLKLAKTARDEIVGDGGRFFEGIFGLNFTVGEWKITVLGYYDNEDENNRSIYLMAEIDGVKFLFTGDGEREAEEKLLSRTKDIDCDVLKVAHHGSNTASGYEFLEHAKPEYAVISSGVGNDYGHPHSATVKALEKMNTEIYRTDTKGDIIFLVDGGEIKIETEK